MGIVTRVLSAVVTLAILSGLPGSAAAAPVAAEGGAGDGARLRTPVTVSINAPAEVRAGDNFTAIVVIAQVQDFGACNYNVSFNAAVLQLDDVTSGNISGTTIPVDIWNQVGSGNFTIVQNVPGLAGVNGAGYLAILHFHVIGPPGQSSNITLSDGVLSDSQPNPSEIPATWLGAVVQITYDLTISIIGNGTVSPSAGVHSYPAGVSVNITGTAASGWAFGYWSGDASGTANPIRVTMNSSMNITAPDTMVARCASSSIRTAGE